MENISETSHALTLENREHLTLSGISDVDSFNEEEIVAICSCGELTIKGELLHIEELNLETGYVSVSGKVTSLTYSEKFSSSSLLRGFSVGEALLMLRLFVAVKFVVLSFTIFVTVSVRQQRLRKIFSNLIITTNTTDFISVVFFID